VLYLLLLLWLQPADHLGGPDFAPWLHPHLYDDNDFTAMALRGLNANLGRTPGRTDQPKIVFPQAYNQSLDSDVPLQERYFLEYPHAALLLFRLGYLFEPEQPRPPAALLDGSYVNITFHRPRNVAEARLWRSFRRVAQVYMFLMTGCLLGLVAVLRVGYLPGAALSSSGLLLLLPSALFFSLNRFDVLPALLVALSLACLGRRWLLASALFLGTATLLKAFPVLLAPLLVRFLWSRHGPRSALLWGGIYTASMGLLFLPALVQDGWTAVVVPYLYQMSRAPESRTIYGYFLPAYLANQDWVGRGYRVALLLLTTIALTWRAPLDLADMLRRSAVLLILFINLSVFYSPQWILWLSPLLLPLAAGRLWLTVLVAALDVVTFLNWPLIPMLPIPVDASSATVVWLQKFIYFSLTGVIYLRLAIYGAILALLLRPQAGRQRELGPQC